MTIYVIAHFNYSNRVQLLLFFTDEINLCLNRARIRHLNGGHEVKPEVIKEMYISTFRLFEENKSLFHRVRLVNVTYQSTNEITASTNPCPDWVLKNGLRTYL